MYETLYKYLKERINISDAEFEIIKTSFMPKKLRKKQYLLQEGDIGKNIAFVEKGLLRLYSIDSSGNENILQFAPEEWWISDRDSIINQTPSKFNIDAVENSELLLISLKDSKELGKKVPQYHDLHDQLQLKNIIAQQKRIHSAISLTAEEKYGEFIKTYPQISSRVPQHMIASYLGLSPETLSRIRRK
jgi:CRP/FNR family transcriptional regulator, anaerobic regulatory protein